MTFNQCTFIDHVGADAKLLTTGTEKTFLKFRLAVSDISGKDKAVLWLTVLVWNGERAEKLAPFVLKGSLVLVTGRVSLHAYTTHERKEKTELELSAQDLQCIAKPKPAAETAPTRQEPAVQATE
ncbi:MAG: single-stranded DNA-binding protein [Acidobacteria bacterium]|nr:single-stranded DNA-binding protein [Acidobacteriota bacterium]